MSDFIISLDPSVRTESLLALLRAPYSCNLRSGWSFSFPWGSVAVLKDLVADDKNVVQRDQCVAGWVGDCVRGEQRVCELLEDLLSIGSVPNISSKLARGHTIEKLNGAYAIFAATESCVLLVTDPMSAVQIYIGLAADNSKVVAVGTHPDLVAQLAGRSDKIDPVSVAEFLNKGTPCWPNTMYSGVTELEAGAVFAISAGPDGAQGTAKEIYWKPPHEITDAGKFSDLIIEFGRNWVAAVQDRIVRDTVGVQLSGGLDSRLLIAAVPEAVKCVGITYCDELNREANVARQVAEAYGHDWKVLYRDSEYVGKTAEQAIRFTGCEGEWHHAHSIGLLKEIQGLGVEQVFTGLFMDNNFKGYYAQDLQPVTRWRGLLPATFEIQDLDYQSDLSEFCVQNLTQSMRETVVQRRQKFYQTHFARGRQSEWEWLDGYPLTQASDNTGWIAERRVLPLRLPVNDRRLVDLAFQVPAMWKAGGRFFSRAAFPVLGPGKRVINANDGVKPGSGHFRRLLQRSARKAQNSARRIASRAGFRTSVPHSWHDYQRYWRESVVLGDLRRQHGHNLEAFAGVVLKNNPIDFLHSPTLQWRTGCRLVQLGVWLSLIKTYSLPAAQRQHRCVIA